MKLCKPTRVMDSVIIDSNGNFHYAVDSMYLGIHWFLEDFVSVIDMFCEGVSNYDGSKLYMEE